MTALLQIDAVSKRFGGFLALDEVTFDLQPGERLGLIGPNGSGKSTLVNCLHGALRNELGRIRFEGRDLRGLTPHERTRMGIARSFQLPKPFRSMTVAENVSVPLLYAAQTRRDSAPDWRDRCDELLARVGLQHKADVLPASLTQVELRKLELIRAVATEPRLLLADESMAGLSAAEVDEILAFLFELNASGTAVILIEHIMSAVMQFAQRLVVLVSGRKVADGSPAEVINDPVVESAYLG